jgi:hypothetical protein
LGFFNNFFPFRGETEIGGEPHRTIPRSVDGYQIGLAQPRRQLNKRVEHGLQIEARTADGLEHIASRGLLLQGLVPLAGKPRDLRLLARRGRFGLRRIAAFRLRRLSTSSFEVFVACFGAPFHRVPRRLMPTPEVASLCWSNKAL